MRINRLIAVLIGWPRDFGKDIYIYMCVCCGRSQADLNCKELPTKGHAEFLTSFVLCPVWSKLPDAEYGQP